MQLGYRYYWDNWDIVSHTFSLNYMRHLDEHIIFGMSWRTYLQNRAYFFKPQYQQQEALMTSDIKLEKGYQYNISLNIYSRHTQTGYWYNGLKNMTAANFNIGIRYRF